MRPWLRAPVEVFVAQFADDAPFAGLTRWVRETAPDLDLHLSSDVAAGVHRARIVSGTVGLIDVSWSPHRFQITPRRPFTRSASGLLDDAWYPVSAAPARVARAVAFGEIAREQAARRARFGVRALGSRAVVTQDYAPVLTTPLESTPEVAAVREALLPAPVPGGSPFFSTAPDAVALADDGVVEFVRVYADRAPELRFAAAQALVDLGLHAGLGPAERAEQRRHFGRLAATRQELGLRRSPPARDAAVRARILVESGMSPRLQEQFRAVRDRLIERGLLADGDIVTDLVEVA